MGTLTLDPISKEGENLSRMTTRRSEDLDVPPRLLEAEAPLPANVRRFPLILPPGVVIEFAQQQRERQTEKAIARHARRKRAR
jgi:hypothetical protein